MDKYRKSAGKDVPRPMVFICIILASMALLAWHYKPAAIPPASTVVEKQEEVPGHLFEQLYCHLHVRASYLTQGLQLAGFVKEALKSNLANAVVEGGLQHLVSTWLADAVSDRHCVPTVSVIHLCPSNLIVLSPCVADIKLPY
jgi:hypothetical protein